uniref:Myosin tail domain-containing protein n=1 Tax=Amphimedon queenslandica TaxID=400682 RepID=A0A1X7TE16_AMPQE
MTIVMISASCSHCYVEDLHSSTEQSDCCYKEAVSQRLQDQVNSLNAKVRNLRRDKEDAESEVESIQKKLRQAKSQLEEAVEESSFLKAHMFKLRSGGGATSLCYHCHNNVH